MVEIAHDTQAIIWDLDGTIINSFSIYESVVTQIAHMFGRPVPTKEAFASNFHGALHDSVHDVFGGVPTQELDEMMEAFKLFQIPHYESLDEHLLEDAVHLAERLQAEHRKQAVVTNRDHEGRKNASPRHIVANTVLRDMIDMVVCGDDGEFRKPDKRVAEGFLKQFHIDPSRVVVIGDQHVDAQLAMNMGARAIIVNRDGTEAELVHKLGTAWEEHVTVVSSLHDVRTV